MKKTLISRIALLAMLAAASTLHAADVASGKGTIHKISADAGTLNMTHEAIPAIKWPAMTMDFKVADKKLLSGVKTGQTVTFGLTKEASGGYVISHIEPAK